MQVLLPLAFAAPLVAQAALGQPTPSPPPLPPLPAPPPTAEPQGSTSSNVPDSAPAPPTTTSTPAPAPPPRSSTNSADVSPTPPPHGQHLHDGFYLRFSAGLSGGWVSGSGPSGSSGISGAGPALLLALGGTPSPGLVVAGTLMIQAVDGALSGAPPGAAGSASTVVPLLGGLVDWYPAPRDGWHLGGSLGLGGVGLTDAAGNNSNGYGLGAAIFGGYDWWIAAQWSLGVMGVIATSTPVDMVDHDRNSSGYEFTPATIALEASLVYQ